MLQLWLDQPTAPATLQHSPCQNKHMATHFQLFDATPHPDVATAPFDYKMCLLAIDDECNQMVQYWPWEEWMPVPKPQTTLLWPQNTNTSLAPPNSTLTNGNAIAFSETTVCLKDHTAAHIQVEPWRPTAQPKAPAPPFECMYCTTSP